MTTTPFDPDDVQQVHRAEGLLAEFNRARVLGAADVHVALRLERIGGEHDQGVLLAAALTVRAVRQGSVCLDLASAAGATAAEGVLPEEVAGLPWPAVASWLAALEASPLVAVGTDGPVDRPLRLVGGLVYLDRYWSQERSIAAYVDGARRRPLDVPDRERLRAAIDRLFPDPAPDRQRLAAVVAAHRRLSILAGGPGTGKTTTVAKLIAMLQDQAQGRLRVALAAPTGKAAARLQEATLGAAAGLDPADRDRIGPVTASTLHRLLGHRHGSSTRFRHDRDNRLPYDVVIVDEASMVSLTLMGRLMDALRPESRLVLVGDPDQLASVEVGAVLGDLVERSAPAAGAADLGDRVERDLADLVERDLADLSDPERVAALTTGVVRLTEQHRFPDEIRDLAEGIRTGDPAAVLSVLGAGHPSIEFVDADPAAHAARLGSLREEVVEWGVALDEAARSGDAPGALAALDRHRLLCAHREGPYGATQWNRRIEGWLGEAIEGYAGGGLWYVGRPLLVTANDYQLRLFNGDAGVVVDIDGEPRAVFRRDGVVVDLAPSRLSDVQTVHALSVHRSQGSQFERVSVLLPPGGSPLLTRELLYTAVTRTERRVRIVGTAAAVTSAVTTPITRASGLAAASPPPPTRHLLGGSHGVSSHK